MRKRLISLYSVWILAGSPATAIVQGQMDDFQDGTTQNWIGGSDPTNIADGGPDGAGDRYLKLTAQQGPLGTVPVLGTNNRTQWTGNYVAAEVLAVGFDLNNYGPELVALRIALFGPGGTFVTTNEFALDAGSGWTWVEFGLGEADLTCTQDCPGTLAQTLAGVTRVLLRHDPDPISTPGQSNAVIATLGVDNVTALPEPGSLPLIAAGLALLACTPRRRG